MKPHTAGLFDVDRRRNGHPAIQAIVRDVRVGGPVVRLELERAAGGDLIEAELNKERYCALALRVGEPVLLRPRTLRVFLTEAGHGEGIASRAVPTGLATRGER